MNDNCKKIFNVIGIFFENLKELDGLLIPREQLLSDVKYNQVIQFIPELKKIFSSSIMTSLQKTANISQKWPLLNLVRQILNVFNYKMTPIRKSDGYTLEGVKKYKRFFQIELINKSIKNDKNTNNETNNETNNHINDDHNDKHDSSK